jgi:plastocyanin
MKKSNKVIITVVVLVIVIGGALMLFMPDKSKAPGTDNTSSNQTNNSSSDSTKAAAATITYDGKTFSSSVSSVKSGDAVKVVNNSSDDLDFDSDPHPVHTDDPELNAGSIAPGESKTFTLTKKGTWGYHNHLNASQEGKITVE